MRFYTLFFLIFLVSYNPAFSGAWLLDEGEELLIQSLYTYRSDTFVNSEGKKTKSDVYSKRELNTYTEFGLRENITLGAIVSYEFVEQGGLENQGAGNAEFFIRTALYEQFPHIISLQTLVKIPTITTGLSPKIGTEGWDAEAKLSYGKSFGNGFLDLGLGYRKRFSKSADQIRWYAKYGFMITENLTLMPSLDGTHKIGAISAKQSLYTLENDYNLIKAELNAYYQLSEKWGVQLGGYKDIYARNTGEGYGGIFGIWRKF